MNASRKIFVALTGLFLILLPLQFAISGYGVFSGDYDAHEMFGAGLLHGIILLMVIFALGARMWNVAGLTFIMFGVVFLQIALVSVGRDNDMLWLSALHPFLAFCYWPYTYFLLWKPVREMSPSAATPPGRVPA